MTAREALTRLQEGNARFARGAAEAPRAGPAARLAGLEGQAPFAIILSCSDSRAPSEILFDQGLGDLFVIRIAGNVVAPSIVGSVEFAASTFGSRLVVVMGHSHCGAITATLDAIQTDATAISDNVRDLVERCRPGVASVVAALDGRARDQLLGLAVRANVRQSCSHLRHGSRVLERLHGDGLRVVGAEYLLETGRVEFFEGVEALP